MRQDYDKFVDEIFRLTGYVPKELSEEDLDAVTHSCQVMHITRPVTRKQSEMVDTGREMPEGTKSAFKELSDEELAHMARLCRAFYASASLYSGQVFWHPSRYPLRSSRSTWNRW